MDSFLKWIHCFLLDYHQEQIKRKRKKTWVREIFKKQIEQGVYHNILQAMNVNENRISGYLDNELFSESNEEKCTAFQRMAWFIVVHKKLLKTAQLLSEHFPSGFSLFVSLISFIHKGKDTSAVPRPSVQHLLYVFLIFFRFHNWFNNFHLSKNILINKFFHRNMCFFIVLPP